MPRTPPAKCMALPCEKCGFATYKFSQLKTKIIAPPPPVKSWLQPYNPPPEFSRVWRACFMLNINYMYSVSNYV